VLLGLWAPRQGIVRLDGADLASLDHRDLGAAIGYLPQSFELLPGTIAENIRRLGPDDPDGVIEAARRAGAHEMILGLPDGYDTLLGQPSFALSGGQRQRIGLARALYKRPSLVVLDEPDAALDREGDIALAAAITSLREEGVTVVVIAHRLGLVAEFDKLLVLNDGRVAAFGPAAEIMSKLVPQAPAVVAMRR
jgi:ATP-binding cassette subfamily C protein EexD